MTNIGGIGKSTIEAIGYDERTREWFRKNIDSETTVIRCEKCRLFYKPSIGHECQQKEEKQ